MEKLHNITILKEYSSTNIKTKDLPNYLWSFVFSQNLQKEKIKIS